MTLATPPFRKFFQGHVRTIPLDVLIKYEVRIVNRIQVIGI